MFTSQVRQVFEADDLALSFADSTLTVQDPMVTLWRLWRCPARGEGRKRVALHVCQISVKSARMLAFCRHPFRSSTFRMDAQLRPSAIRPNEEQKTLPQRRVLLPFDICIPGRTSASAASEHCPGHKATTSRIVVVEEPTH